MKLLVPALLGLILAAFGGRVGGAPAAALMGAVGLLAGWSMGRLVRSRKMRQAPAAPPLRAGETPLLHGPVRLLQEGGARACWAYLSDRRLSLLPEDLGEGVDLELSRLDEIRPLKRRWRSGELSVVVEGRSWRLRLPDVRRWERALRDAARRKP